MRVMKLSNLAYALGLSLVGMAGTAVAGEGMWVPQQLPEIAGPLKKAGLRLDAKQLSDLTGDPMGAVVSLGGCTASFVSPKGLVVTNHHCAYGAIQLNSTAERNYIQDGFYAKSLSEEVSAGPGSRVFVLDQITDVTARVQKAIAGANTPAAREKAVDMLEKQLVADCEQGGGYRCSLSSFFGGTTYRLFRNMEIQDVRLVYAPPSSVGKYGGDVDNWMWPRHTGDFSFYRAYVGKDGKPAPFAKDNVPYQPKHILQFTDTPLGEGDFVMVAGYPGRTSRYALASEFNDTVAYAYPTSIRHYHEVLKLIDAESERNKDVGVKYAATNASLNNVMKNYEGQLEGFKRINAAKTKADEEAKLIAWLKAQAKSKNKVKAGKAKSALAAITAIESANGERTATRDRDFIVPQLSGGTVGIARQLYRLAIEREKPNAEREQGYQDRDLSRIEAGLKQFDRRYDYGMDAQLKEYWLQQYVALPAAQRVAYVDSWLGGNDSNAIRTAIASLKDTELNTLEGRTQWFKADRKAFETSTDPVIRLAVASMPFSLAEEAKAKTRGGESLVNRPRYMQALIDYRKSKGLAVYPDANSTLRITFGNVKAYTKQDGSKQNAFTRLEEIPAKDTGKEPFDAPKAQLDAIAAKDYSTLADARLGTVPVNFLSDLDITGGNSGSPVLDADGKLVGLAFDGNWESVSSNWVFDPTMTRMIAVDQRYIRWIMEKVAPAPELLKELNVPVMKSAK